jgi:hypothetical protein
LRIFFIFPMIPPTKLVLPKNISTWKQIANKYISQRKSV